MAKVGPPAYSEKERERIIAHVLGELSSGVPISRTLNEDREEWLCSQRCWWNWYYEADADDPNGLVQKVARARDCGSEAQMDRAAYVAETPMLGEIVTEEPAPGDSDSIIRKVRTEDMLGHRKLLVDTLIKQAQMLKPKTYGPKLDLTTKGDKIGGLDALRLAEERDRELAKRREQGEE